MKSIIFAWLYEAGKTEKENEKQLFKIFKKFLYFNDF